MAFAHRSLLLTLSVTLLLVLGGVGCSSDGGVGAGGSGGAAGSGGTDEPFVPEAYGEWLKFEPEGAVCANGSQYKFFVNFSEASSNLVIFLEGGGACSTYESCANGGPFNTDCIKEEPGAECIRDDYPAVYLHLDSLEPFTAVTEPIGVVNGDVPVELAYPPLSGDTDIMADIVQVVDARVG